MSHLTHSLCELCSLVSLTEREDSAPEGTESNATLVVDGDKRVKRRLLMGRRLPHPSLATVVDPLPPSFTTSGLHLGPISPQTSWTRVSSSYQARCVCSSPTAVTQSPSKDLAVVGRAPASRMAWLGSQRCPHLSLCLGSLNWGS